MKKTSRIIASALLVVAIIFILYSLNHPECSFPWNNVVTYIIYVIYAAITIFLFIVSFRK